MSPEPRPWLLEHINALPAGDGRWETSNAGYRSDQQPFDAYRLVWRKGPGGRSAFGEMTGVTGERETPPLREFRIYWHPAAEQARIMQFSASSIFGDGAIEMRDDRSDVSIQQFHPPGGEPFRIRHESCLSEGVHETASFMEDDSGEWRPNREYTWPRQ